MSGARESGLWKWLRKAEKVLRDDLDMNRVENFLAAGMPDVEGTLTKHQFFVELKSTARPAKPETPVRFAVKDREAQINWLEKRWKLAGNAWLLLQVGSGHAAHRYLVPGKWARRVYEGVPEEVLATMSMCDVKDTAVRVVLLASRSKGKTYE